MEHLKYQHIERIGTDETNGITIGICYIFPKIDGTNTQLWIDKGFIYAGSKNRTLSFENDHFGFFAWAINHRNIKDFFLKYPNLRLYGEWLVPHTLKTYQKTAWNQFYVFDVMDGDKYLSYDEYKSLLDEFKIEYIPPICKIKNPTYERLISLLEKNVYLIEDGKGTGEGIVIKNYDYKNKYGNIIWAKIVKNEFKTAHAKSEILNIKEKDTIEKLIVNKYITLPLIEKEYTKIESENGWTSKQIPRFLNTVFYLLIKEECWNFIKEFKNPTIDFKKLSYFTTVKIKELKPNLF